MVRSIKQLLRRRPDIVIRRTDKCKVFYVGRAMDFERKTVEYMLKTEAYQQLETNRCPLIDIMKAVQSLLNDLFSKDVLTKKQCRNLLPKINQVELAHYHGLPKPHKVNELFPSIHNC